MGSCFKNKDNKTSAEVVSFSFYWQKTQYSDRLITFLLSQCFSTCISKKLNLLKNGAFDSDAFKAYISKQAATDAVWSPIVNEALKNCTVIANNMPTGDSKCDRSIESNIGCLHFAMLKNCPTTKKSTCKTRKFVVDCNWNNVAFLLQPLNVSPSTNICKLVQWFPNTMVERDKSQKVTAHHLSQDRNCHNILYSECPTIN